MKRTANKTKSILLMIMAIPLLSAFMLTITCSLGDFVFDCCAKPATVQAEHQGYSTSHHAHDPDTQASHTHSGTHQESSEGPHSREDDDCCNDLTTAFFSVFQVQPHQFVADQPAPFPPLPAVAFIPEIHNYYVDQSQVYHGFEPPPRFYQSGRLIRILYQSFLN